jgi:hypothetical protein
LRRARYESICGACAHYRRAAEDKAMRNLTPDELKAVSGGASKNAGGGPGNSGPGDKNSRNERGHGGQPTG